ncbi:MAG: ankyrin repeat domain-containing protein [Fibrobacteria bacterium]|nr:ankyrin repeat domain-containing protein [Fibrobacteria bacterium]
MKLLFAFILSFLLLNCEKKAPALTPEEIKNYKEILDSAFAKQKFEEADSILSVFEKQKIDPNPILPEKAWPMMISMGKKESVKKLINAGYDVNTQFSRMTGIFLAIYWGHRDIVNMLIKAGADVNYRYDRGETPLSYAVNQITGDYEIAKALIKAGADVNAHDTTQKTVLMNAAQSAYPNILELLIKHKADINAKDKDGETALFYAIKGMVYDTHHGLIKTKLGKAGQFRNTEGELPQKVIDSVVSVNKKHRRQTFRVLLENGGDPNLPNKDGSTPLMLAVKKTNPMITTMLLQKATKEGVTNPGALFFEAVSGRNLNIIRQVLEIVKDSSVVNSRATVSKKTALISAASNGALEVVELLIDLKADINARDAFGTTALHEAAYNGHIRIVERLLEKKADANANGENGTTPLMSAAYQGHAAACSLLVQSGADVNITDKLKSNALMEALDAYEENPAIIQLLVKSGTNLKHKNKAGKTALDIAKKKGWKKAIALLK